MFTDLAYKVALGCVNPATWLPLASSLNLGPALSPSSVFYAVVKTDISPLFVGRSFGSLQKSGGGGVNG